MKIADFLFKNKIQIDSILEKIKTIRENHDILCISASPTGSSWLGVYNAGLSLFPENHIEIPQYYSKKILSDIQLLEISEKISSLNFKQVIFNAFNDYFELIITSLKKKNSSVQIGNIHHGFFAEMIDNEIIRSNTGIFIRLLNDGFIDKIAFLKKGNAEIFNALFPSIRTYLIYNLNPVFPNNYNPDSERLGVLTSGGFRKNNITQIVAGLAINKYKIIVSQNPDIEYLDKHNKIHVLGHIPHVEFLKEMALNRINTHVTFSEASGGQVFTESLALGVPCLTSETHGYLDFNKELKDALIVKGFDNSEEIKKKLIEIDANRSKLSELGYSYSQFMNKKAEESLLEFLN